MDFLYQNALDYVITVRSYFTSSRTKVRFKIVFGLFTYSTLFSSRKKKQQDQLSIWVQEQRENL